jgi:hypothetical protein
MTANDAAAGPANPYAKEAQQRWGHTDAYKESQKRVAKMTKDDWARIQAEGDTLCKELAASMGKDPASPEVQALVERHYNGLRAFFEPNLEMYRGLADMYVADPRFTAFYDKYAPGLATFLRDAMQVYCDASSTRS